MTIAQQVEATEPTHDPKSDDAGGRLARVLQPLLDEARGRPHQTLVSATIAVTPSDPIALFAAARQRGDEPSIWRQPDPAMTLLAVGAAWRLRASGEARFEAIERAWAALQRDALVAGDDVLRGTGPLLLGGLGFSAVPATSPTWIGFEAADMVLPQLLLTASPAGSWLTACLVVPGIGADMPAGDQPSTAADLTAAWQDLQDATATRSSRPATEGALRIAAQRPEAPEWRATVARFAGAVGRGRIDKAVISRQIDLVAERPVDVEQLIERLASSAPEATVFAVTRGTRAFVGATPERLVRLEGLDFQTLALAGSTRRASDPLDDARLASELLGSDKEREEHAVVVHMLRDSLAPIAASLAIPAEPSVRRLRHVQHLATEVSGSLGEPMGILSLVSRLHPTPAVGGAPRELALEMIDEEERGERGWYAGPLGWLDRHGDGEFVVALRCGLVDGARATLFAGCGIVADSDPDREWDESALKLRAFGSALGRFET